MDKLRLEAEKLLDIEQFEHDLVHKPDSIFD